MSQQITEEQAQVMERIRITGTLRLESPLLIGAGGMDDRKDETDIHVLTDKNNTPFIPGTSLAGVLRDYCLRQDQRTGELLFGIIHPGKRSDEDIQSAVSIEDIVLENTAITVRDSVCIDGFTGTGIDGRKFDYEAVERGAKGELSMLVTLRGRQLEEPGIKTALQKLLGYMKQGFCLGARTTKGFGQAAVKDLKAIVYDFSQAEDVRAWLENRDTAKVLLPAAAGDVKPKDDLIIEADFALRSSLIVRDYDTDEKNASGQGDISAVQKKSNGAYVIPGTSIKGVLRHQAEYILRVLDCPADALDDLMGYVKENSEEKSRSRFYVRECYFKDGIKEAEQSRNRIERFTGGTVEAALFTTKPVWQEKAGEKTLTLHYEIRDCQEWEAGLALFLLRDLWQGEVALGGEKSIGRGTLQGLHAAIDFKEKHYELGADGKPVAGDAAELEKYARALAEEAGK